MALPSGRLALIYEADKGGVVVPTLMRSSSISTAITWWGPARARTKAGDNLSVFAFQFKFKYTNQSCGEAK